MWQLIIGGAHGTSNLVSRVKTWSEEDAANLLEIEESFTVIKLSEVGVTDADN
jgi:hypothetical protein